MSDGVNFVNFPRWDEMDFSRNCTAFGNWLAAFLVPNPWNPTESLGGSFGLSITLFVESLPTDFKFPENSSVPVLSGEIGEWFTWNLINVYNKSADTWDMNPQFQQRVFVDPIENCPVEFCKAVGYTGNADLTGIGVSESCFLVTGNFID
jgi:hypothetical protein